MKRQDVIIVGGGPAGCVLSLLLARSGLHVSLLEKDTRLDRTFRGPVYQPSAIRIWDEMGILEDIKALDHSTFDNFSFIQDKETLLKMDLRELPPPYNYIFVVKQAPLLRCLIKQCLQYSNFTYYGGCHATGVVEEDNGVSGVVAKCGDIEHIIRGKLVVAADGRFSTIRQALDIDLEKVKQHFDVVWFELPNLQKIPFDVGFQISEGGFVLFLPKEENHIQIGLVLPKGEFPKLRKKGIEAFVALIAKAKPELGNQLIDYLTSWDQCELLDVKIAIAESWAHKGALLIGDAAHIASPVGGIGNKLAIEDAAIAHPIIVNAIKQSDGPVPKELLDVFEKQRRDDITTALDFQKFVGKAVLEMKNPLAVWLRNLIAPHLQKTPLYKKARKIITTSPHDIHVDTSLFVNEKTILSHSYNLLPVKEVFEETPSSKTIVFDVPESLKAQYRVKAGQFLTLRLVVDGLLYTRCYSLSSGEEEGRVSITVKRQEGGVVSTYLNDAIQSGDRINILPPSGNFTLPETETSSYVFFSGGSGITPVYAMISTLLNTDPSANIQLFYVNRNHQETIFFDKLMMLTEKHSNFHLTLVLTVPEDTTWKGLTGRPNIEMLKKYYQDIAAPNQAYFLCGPKGFMSTVRSMLEGEGIDKASIFQEDFYSIPGVHEQEHSAHDAGDTVSSEKAVVDENAKPESVMIELMGEETTLSIDADTTILDAALDAGLNAPFSCQQGICGTCRATLKEGKVFMETHDALSDEEIEEKKILTCQAKLRSQKARVSYDE